MLEGPRLFKAPRVLALLANVGSLSRTVIRAKAGIHFRNP
jgi:hypothetical protein